MKTTKPKPNISLLRKIQKAILKYPNQFNMGWWFQECDSQGDPAGRCGTAACIAGWAVALSRQFNGKKLNVVKNKTWDASEKAAELLKIPVERIWPPGGSVFGSSKHPLFFTEQWPVRFRRQYKNAISAKEAAKAASDRIDYFIKTGK